MGGEETNAFTVSSVFISVAQYYQYITSILPVYYQYIAIFFCAIHITIPLGHNGLYCYLFQLIKCELSD